MRNVTWPVLAAVMALGLFAARCYSREDVTAYREHGGPAYGTVVLAIAFTPGPLSPFQDGMRVTLRRAAGSPLPGWTDQVVTIQFRCSADNPSPDPACGGPTPPSDDYVLTFENVPAIGGWKIKIETFYTDGLATVETGPSGGITLFGPFNVDANGTPTEVGPIVPNWNTGTVRVQVDNTAVEPSPGPPCQVVTCEEQGKNCGMVSDGCGGMQDCGTCTAPLTCGGGGTPNVCGHTPGRWTYVVNSADNSVSVIDTTSNTVAITISVPMVPRRVAFSPDGARAYVSSPSSNTVSIIDTTSHAVVEQVSATGFFPWGLAPAPDGTLVYVTSDGLGFGQPDSVSILSTATDTIAATLAWGAGPRGAAFTDDGTQVWIAGPCSGCIRVLSVPDNTEVATISGMLHPDRIAVAETIGYGNSSCGCCGALQRISLDTQSVTHTLSFAGTGAGLALAPDGSAVYAGTWGHCGPGPSVKKLNPANLSEVSSINLAGPDGIAVTPDGSQLYVASNAAPGVVSVVDTGSFTVLTAIPVGNGPADVAISP